MHCPQTPDVLAASCELQTGTSLSPELQAHVDGCALCRAELMQMAPVTQALTGWQNEQVPEWNRRDVGLLGHHHKPGKRGRKALSRIPLWASSWQQWAPLAASMVLAVAVLMQTSVSVSDQGWSVSFGGAASNADVLSLPQLEAYLAQYAEQQQEWNQQVLQVALQQFGDHTAESLYEMVTWFDDQRELDLQRMEAGFQQMLDRDYQTVNSMQQLASFVQFQGELQ
jgi:hypothetical protein